MPRSGVVRTGSSSSSSASSARPATSSTSPSTRSCSRSSAHYLPAAIGSFLVAVTNNYTWNRVWTFRGQRGHVVLQGSGSSSCPRRLWAPTCSSCTCWSRRARRGRRPGARDHARDPGELHREQDVVVPPPALSAGRRVLHARRRGAPRARRRAVRTRGPGRRRQRRRGSPRRRRSRRSSRTRRSPTGSTATRPGPVTGAACDPRTGDWTVNVWSGDAGEVARGRPRRTRGVTEAWTGPQVAWRMARGRPGAFGGRFPQLVAGLARPLGDLPARSRRPAAAAPPADPRPARPPLLRRLARVLQPRQGLPELGARRAPAPLPRGAHRDDRLPHLPPGPTCCARASPRGRS